MKFSKITGAIALTLAASSIPAMAVNVRTARRLQSNSRQAFSSNSAPSGWNAMDRNGDGVISRNEWTGTQAEFDRLNTNRDNVLTPTELRNSGAWANRAGNGHKRFKGMDRNKDGVITRDEWRGNDQSFRQHDLNGDNVLSGDELRGKEGDKDDDDQGDDQRHDNSKKHDKHDKHDD